MNRLTEDRDTGAANLAFAMSLVDGLQAAGVTSVVLCPGSRSTPLALAVASRPGLRCSVHLDERNAAFHALGHAKASRRPVVLLCTSGTAGANFLPAVAEASYARVPLVVLTADRPPELRAWGAAQTMEQRTLFAGFTRWQEEAPCPSEGGVDAAYARALAWRAVREATGAAPGPVHLNLPFREPLVPAVPALVGPVADLDAVRTADVGLLVDAQDPSGALAGQLRRFDRGVLVFGPDDPQPGLAAAVQRLAAGLGWPVIADPASGLRAEPVLAGKVIHAADLLLRDDAVAAALQPELIVRFGAWPTAKSLQLWMARHRAADVWLVDPAGGCRDPQHRASRHLRSSPLRFCELGAAAAGPARPAAQAWLERWRHAERVARAAVTSAMDADGRFLAPQLARALWAALPADGTLYVANSMVIRDVDAYAGPRDRPLRVLANRGVNGIDGLVSAALGAASALRGPTVLWCGDIALLHDLAGLLAGRLHDAELTIVVSNDDGGGIFEYLPVAQAVPRSMFEPVFAVPHGLDLSVIARGLGWSSLRVSSADAFGEALTRALAGGRHVIEVPIDRAANTACHLALGDAVREGLRREPLP